MNRRRQARFALLGLAVLTWWPAHDLRAQALRSVPADPFAELHANLDRAADLGFAQLVENARRAAARETASARPSADLAAAYASEHAPFPSASLRALAVAQERLRTLGVDAARIFAEEGVPLELLTVAAAESGFDPVALSRKGARGLWQLMPATATQFGLRVDAQADDRLRPARATRAAARHLRQLHLQFGDWLLALAAYNAGEARVARAIARAGTRDFWELAVRGGLPEETRRYVPAVLAAMQKQ